MKVTLLVLVLGLSACSVSGEISIGAASPEDATEDVIESALAEQLGFGELVASCSKPASEDVGSRFLCTAATEDGRTVELQAIIEDDGPFVETTNVVLIENLVPVRRTILGQIKDQSGWDLPDRALDCGTESLIVDESNRIVCSLTDPAGDTFDTIITFHGLDTDETTFDWMVDTDG